MARKEVLVQLEDDLVLRLDEIATSLGISRSELLRRGAKAIIETAEMAAADRELVEAYKRLPQDAQMTEGLLRLAVETWPEW